MLRITDYISATRRFIGHRRTSGVLYLWWMLRRLLWHLIGRKRPPLIEGVTEITLHCITPVVCDEIFKSNSFVHFMRERKNGDDYPVS